MEYFWLRQDERESAILLPGLINLIPYQDIKSGNVDKLEDLTPIILPTSRYHNYADILTRQMVVIQKPLKEIFDLFEPDLLYKVFCTMDLPNRQHVYYYAPHLPGVDCYSDSNKSKPDRNRMVLRKETLPDSDIFRVNDPDRHIVIVALAVAECILRRKLKGIRLTRVELEV